MTEASALVENILRRQNGDGGWAFSGSSPSAISWTEPTALALLALEAADVCGEAHVRGRDWLLRRQCPDGGWSPCSPVDSSTSVTSAGYLALSSFANRDIQDRAIRWLISQTKPDLTPLQRVEFWMDNMPPNEHVMGGSPWFPGTAAWVAPTVMAALAFAQARRNSISSLDLHVQIQRATKYLLSRRCQDGGWNHGGTQFRSAAAFSYPEMTGMALLAIPPTAESLGHTIAVAEQMWRQPASSEGQSWLRMGLLKHGRAAAELATPLPCRTTRDMCLQLLAVCAASPSNKLMTSVV